MGQPRDQAAESLDERGPMASHLGSQLPQARARRVDEARLRVEGVEDPRLELGLLRRHAEPVSQQRPPRALLPHESGEPARGLQRTGRVDQRAALECRALHGQQPDRPVQVLDERGRQPRDPREVHSLSDFRQRRPRLGDAGARLPSLQRPARERGAGRPRHELAHAVPLEGRDRLRIELHAPLTSRALTPGAPSRAR